METAAFCSMRMHVLHGCWC